MEPQYVIGLSLQGSEHTIGSIGIARNSNWKKAKSEMSNHMACHCKDLSIGVAANLDWERSKSETSNHIINVLAD